MVLEKMRDVLIKRIGMNWDSLPAGVLYLVNAHWKMQFYRICSNGYPPVLKEIESFLNGLGRIRLVSGNNPRQDSAISEMALFRLYK